MTPTFAGTRSLRDGEGHLRKKTQLTLRLPFWTLQWRGVCRCLFFFEPVWIAGVFVGPQDNKPLLRGESDSKPITMLQELPVGCCYDRSHLWFILVDLTSQVPEEKSIYLDFVHLSPCSQYCLSELCYIWSKLCRAAMERQLLGRWYFFLRYQEEIHGWHLWSDVFHSVIQGCEYNMCWDAPR